LAFARRSGFRADRDNRRYSPCDGKHHDIPALPQARIRSARRLSGRFRNGGL